MPTYEVSTPDGTYHVQSAGPLTDSQAYAYALGGGGGGGSTPQSAIPGPPQGFDPNYGSAPYASYGDPNAFAQNLQYTYEHPVNPAAARFYSPEENLPSPGTLLQQMGAFPGQLIQNMAEEGASLGMFNGEEPGTPEYVKALGHISSAVANFIPAVGEAQLSGLLQNLAGSALNKGSLIEGSEDVGGDIYDSLNPFDTRKPWYDRIASAINLGATLRLGSHIIGQQTGANGAYEPGAFPDQERVAPAPVEAEPAETGPSPFDIFNRDRSQNVSRETESEPIGPVAGVEKASTGALDSVPGVGATSAGEPTTPNAGSGETEANTQSPPSVPTPDTLASESPVGQEEVGSASHAGTDGLRQAFGLMEQRLGGPQSWADAWEASQGPEVQSDLDSTMEKAAAGGRAITAPETLAIYQRAMQYRSQWENLTTKADDAQEGPAKDVLTQKAQEAYTNLETAITALENGGSELGRGLNIRQAIIPDEYTVEGALKRAGGQLDPDVAKKLMTAQQAIDDVNRRLAEAEGNAKTGLTQTLKSATTSESVAKEAWNLKPDSVSAPPVGDAEFTAFMDQLSRMREEGAC